MTDAELWASLRAGDDAAFDATFRAWYVMLVHAVARIVHDRGAAEEIVQDVMLELWRRREQLPDDGSPQAYLFRSARNRALNHLRHLRVQRRSEPALTAEPRPDLRADTDLAGDELALAAARAIAELPPRTREVFELSRGRGLRYAEIADLLGISVKAVEANMGRALRMLREQLAPWLPEGDSL